jgi:mRNA-degrading endonuclease RelE of RelBE toxin-antitoxin system
LQQVIEADASVLIGSTTQTAGLRHPPALSWKIPRRIGKPLRDELTDLYSARLGAQWRVVYRVDESKHTVIAEDIEHRSAAYRPR